MLENKIKIVKVLKIKGHWDLYARRESVSYFTNY